jgi:hypothetical protein
VYIYLDKLTKTAPSQQLYRSAESSIDTSNGFRSNGLEYSHDANNAHRRVCSIIAANQITTEELPDHKQIVAGTEQPAATEETSRRFQRRVSDFGG